MLQMILHQYNHVFTVEMHKRDHSLHDRIFTRAAFSSNSGTACTIIPTTRFQFMLQFTRCRQFQKKLMRGKAVVSNPNLFT